MDYHFNFSSIWRHFNAPIAGALARGRAGEIAATRLADRRSALFERMLAWPD